MTLLWYLLHNVYKKTEIRVLTSSPTIVIGIVFVPLQRIPMWPLHSCNQCHFDEYWMPSTNCSRYCTSIVTIIRQAILWNCSSSSSYRRRSRWVFFNISLLIVIIHYCITIPDYTVYTYLLYLSYIKQYTSTVNID